MAPIQNMHRVNKKGAKILTVEPATQTIHASLGAGQVVPVNMYTYTPVVRWPKVGETWWLREENGSWFLDSIMESQGIPGEETQAEPGDAVISSSSGRLLLNQGGKLTQIQSSKFSLIEKYVKQPGRFFYNTPYTPSSEYVTLAIISQGTANGFSYLYIDGGEVAELQYQGSITPMTLIIPKGQTWEIRGLHNGELRSVAYAFFPS